MFRFGIENLLSDKNLKNELQGKRIAILGHPASVDQNLNHSLDLLKQCFGDSVVCAFGPQHGMRGEKQDNMIESDDYLDPVYKIPVFSLYGRVRRPTEKMLKSFDVLLVDLQDVGCRIYTFLTTLFYMIDAVQGDSSKEIWVLDRPNPAGRNVEGLTLDMSYESFVGAAPLPMRHGLTLGEAGQWYKNFKNYDIRYRVVPMTDYNMHEKGEWGWPSSLTWVNPSPNMPRLSCVRQYAGTVLIEGTYLSEGRGTTLPLEVVGAPKLNIDKILRDMQSLAPQWMEGCKIRPHFFEPTFHKFKGELCAGIQIHLEGEHFDYIKFKPFRLLSLFFKSLRRVHPEFKLWKSPPYEYEERLLPIEILAGDASLKSWVDDPRSSVQKWEEMLLKDESAWEKERSPFLLYP